MPLAPCLLDTRDWPVDDIEGLFQSARWLKSKSRRDWPSFNSENLLAALLFFEPSTRTRMSFQAAALRLGIKSMVLDSPQSSSLVKGESFQETLLNVKAMGPDIFVVRAGPVAGLKDELARLGVPVVSAGLGSELHPTQALLDAFTIQQRLGEVRGQRVLLVGDVAHNRTAHSNLDVLSRLGAEVGFCAPRVWWPLGADWQKANKFDSLDEGLKWCTVVMGLRVQLERHSSANRFDQAGYHQDYGLNSRRLKTLSTDGLIMHPGPIGFGWEFAPDVMNDKRNVVYEQVTNGVYIRAAVLMKLLNLT